MIKVTAFLTTAALVISMPLAAHSEDYASGAVKTMKTAKGEVLTDAKGMTLYVFDKDSKGHPIATMTARRNGRRWRLPRMRKWIPSSVSSRARMARNSGHIKKSRYTFGRATKARRCVW